MMDVPTPTTNGRLMFAETSLDGFSLGWRVPNTFQGAHLLLILFGLVAAIGLGLATVLTAMQGDQIALLLGLLTLACLSPMTRSTSAESLVWLEGGRLSARQLGKLQEVWLLGAQTEDRGIQLVVRPLDGSEPLALFILHLTDHERAWLRAQLVQAARTEEVATGSVPAALESIRA
jgi:hypothetical protein